ncbi:MAG: 4-alpha-glucanotransferase [Candidatus Peribacter riflensis]|uniref:4-alpha-glucanotransferase n=1 Tax=Candidatus Peribacter riflensis TaxID=1735162 RepID=A0A0S1SPM2_9BACT|nr:MAG: 4-alpha-glucanotransferase [Candidatus Peribacter riflensis]ALM11144.1 MAG: 4-alpha-glucanotransferase [Candidatus Peribacter riflensis]ALM12247.1 MAG: 4-alpha-glucanotransferase [Candidatus Peribacter riflensis]ALM13349.1 MAG: 4-alpha-glucanotransferase [Candidatus Peribacter riflensis]ALM14450.1 MAG: 4-alpha-glucanotransferase [Candidatus Peribacter riflensis]
MFGWEYPPRHLGGLGVACQGLVRGLINQNVKVTLVLPFAADGSQENVDVLFPTEKHISTIRVASLLLPYDSPDQYVQRIQAIPRETAEMYGDNLGQAVHIFTETSVEMTRDLQPDVVHAHDWMTYEAGTRSARFHGKPLVAHIHATELDRTHFHPNEWIYGRERWGFQQADHIIAVSNYTRNILIQHYGIDPDKISVVHNGSSESRHVESAQQPETTTPTKKRPMVLFLGRLTIQKGPLHFLEMASMVHRLRPDVQFVVAGDGHMLPSLMDQAVQLGLEDCIIFSGKVSNTEARKLYAQASCFVMPSLSEPFGLVALEAIAQDTPVILSKQSGASEVIGHAFKVDFWDTEKMADCVLTVLREAPLASQLISEAPRVLQHLTWDNQAGKVLSIYRNILHS